MFGFLGALVAAAREDFCLRLKTSVFYLSTSCLSSPIRPLARSIHIPYWLRPVFLTLFFREGRPFLSACSDFSGISPIYWFILGTRKSRYLLPGNFYARNRLPGHPYYG